MQDKKKIDLNNWEQLLDRDLIDLGEPLTLLESSIPILKNFIKKLLAKQQEANDKRLEEVFLKGFRTGANNIDYDEGLKECLTLKSEKDVGIV